jgi:NAD-dependent deacetylase
VIKLVVLTGAGVSAESGISTFRDKGGLWEGHDIMEVASPIGWSKNKELVLDFYNQRRRQLKDVQPNDAHFNIKKLEEKYEVTVITQNVDNLHERAGSKNILHLHGELTKARSTVPPYQVYEIGFEDISLGDHCEKGAQLRPHIVWFGEPVPEIENASVICSEADIFVVVGSSLVVYPAAGLVQYVSDSVPKYIIDPVRPEMYNYYQNLTFIEDKATTGTDKLLKELNIK